MEPLVQSVAKILHGLQNDDFPAGSVSFGSPNFAEAGMPKWEDPAPPKKKGGHVEIRREAKKTRGSARLEH